MKWLRSYGDEDILGNDENDRRKTERLENVFEFWRGRTLEAHHIVEYNNVEELHVRIRGQNDDLAYSNFPCVLLAAEFHQSKLTTEMVSGRDSFGPRASAADAGKKLRVAYSDLYLSKIEGGMGKGLNDIAEILISEIEDRIREQRG
jgi:hypothetical protein